MKSSWQWSRGIPLTGVVIGQMGTQCVLKLGWAGAFMFAGGLAGMVLLIIGKHQDTKAMLNFLRGKPQ